MRKIPFIILAAALALPAFAVRTSEVISQTGLAAIYNPDGSQGKFNGNPGLSGLFDGNFDVGVVVNTKDSYVIVDFTPLFTNANLTAYISEIDIGHKGNCDYSLYYGDIDSNGATNWIAVAEAARTTGTAIYPLGVYATFVKYVFYTISSWSPSLCELQVKGFVSTKPVAVSNYGIASFHNADGTIEPSDFGGGDNWGANAGRRLFDGNFTTYWPQPRAQVGSFIMVDFTKNDGSSTLKLKEYYVSKILIGSSGTMAFTLQYSDTGTNDWKNVPGAVNVKYEGIGTFEVGALAKYVRYVFNEVNWGYAMSQGYLAEIQVVGMDPEDAPCIHPSFTDWTESVPVSCTDRAKLSRTCNECGETFMMYSDQLPLGHDYNTTLTRSGRYRHPGTGSISCKRCDFVLNFPEPIDLVTSRVDGVLICGRKTEGIVRFVDYDVSSENHPEWGPAALNLVNNNWGIGGEWPFWMSASEDNQYVDFAFGTEIDLTAVEFSVYNHGYILRFFRLDEATGAETLLAEQEVVRDDSVVGTKTETKTEIDPTTGEETTIEVEVEVAADYQRIRVPFFDAPVKTLRVRVEDLEPMPLWGATGVRVLEVHPWGTVKGAGEPRYRRETLLIFK